MGIHERMAQREQHLDDVLEMVDRIGRWLEDLAENADDCKVAGRDLRRLAAETRAGVPPARFQRMPPRRGADAQTRQA